MKVCVYHINTTRTTKKNVKITVVINFILFCFFIGLNCESNTKKIIMVKVNVHEKLNRARICIRDGQKGRLATNVSHL